MTANSLRLLMQGAISTSYVVLLHYLVQLVTYTAHVSARLRRVCLYTVSLRSALRPPLAGIPQNTSLPTAGRRKSERVVHHRPPGSVYSDQACNHSHHPCTIAVALQHRPHVRRQQWSTRFSKLRNRGTLHDNRDQFETVGTYVDTTASLR